MLNHPTQDKLLTLKLLGMAQALEEQRRLPACDAMSFEERLGLLVDREMTARGNRQLAQRLKRAVRLLLADADTRSAEQARVRGRQRAARELAAQP